MTSKRILWYSCVSAVVILCVLCFTPLVIPMHHSEPRVFGLPRTLWLGMLIYVAIVLLTFIASRVYTQAEDEGASE